MIDVKTIGSIALRAVKANKLRSTLTSLGIIIGVAAANRDRRAHRWKSPHRNER